MKNISVLIFRLAICLGLVWPNLSTATLLTYTFTGVVTEVNSELSGEFSVGESVLYRTTIPANAADINPDPNISTYETGLVDVLIGDYSATKNGTTLNIRPSVFQSTFDGITAALIAPTLPPSIELTEINMVLVPQQDFTSTTLPTNLELVDFDLAGMGLDFDGRLVRTHFTSLEVTTTVNPAPEPSTIALLVAGIFGVVLVRSKYVA